MHTAVPGGDIARERLYVRGKQFLRGAVFQDGVDDGAAVRKGQQSLLIGAPAALRAFLRLRVELHLLEQHLAYLLGRGHVQAGLASQLAHLRLALLRGAAQGRGEVGERSDVDLDARPLHAGQDADQRLLHFPVKGGHAGSVQLRKDLVPQKQYHRRLTGPVLSQNLLRLIRAVPEKHAGIGRLRSGTLQVQVKVTAGKHVQRMAAFGIQYVVDQLDVHQVTLKPYSGIVQTAELELDAESVLLHGRVLQQVAEGVGGAGGGQQTPAVGHGGGDARHGGEDALPLRLRDEGAASGPAGRRGQFIDTYRTDFQLLGSRFRRQRLRNMGYIALERIELVLLEKVGQDRAVRHVHLHVLRTALDRDVRLDGHQGLAEGYVVLRFGEHRLLAGRQFLQMVVDSLHASVLGDELRGTDFTHALDARDVVRGVSADGQHVDDLRGVRDPVLGAYRRGIQYLVVTSGLARLVLVHMGSHQLSVVLVRRDHVHVEALPCGAQGHGAYHVVGLEPRDHQDRDVHRPDYLRQGLEGVDDELRRVGTVGLVLRVHLVAESAARRVEGHGQVRGLLPLDEFEQVLGETEKYGGVHAFRVDHGPPQKGIVHLEDQRVAVDQEEFSVHYS